MIEVAMLFRKGPKDAATAYNMQGLRTFIRPRTRSCAAVTAQQASGRISIQELGKAIGLNSVVSGAALAGIITSTKWLGSSVRGIRSP